MTMRKGKADGHVKKVEDNLLGLETVSTQHHRDSLHEAADYTPDSAAGPPTPMFAERLRAQLSL